MRFCRIRANSTPSQGFLLGPSVTSNAAMGKGAWSRLFDSAGGSFGPAPGGALWSPPGGDDPGYFGVQGGIGKGPPGVGTTTTNHTKRAQLTYPGPNNCRGNRSGSGIASVAMGCARRGGMTGVPGYLEFRYVDWCRANHLPSTNWIVVRLLLMTNVLSASYDDAKIAHAAFYAADRTKAYRTQHAVNK